MLKPSKVTLSLLACTLCLLGYEPFAISEAPPTPQKLSTPADPFATDHAVLSTNANSIPQKPEPSIPDYDLARTALNHKQYAEAEKLARQALSWTEKNRPANSRPAALSNHLLSQALFAQQYTAPNKFFESKRYIQRALSIFSILGVTKHNDDDIKILSLHLMAGHIAGIERQFDNMKEQFQTALPIAQKFGEAAAVQNTIIQTRLDDIAHFESAPDYFSHATKQGMRWKNPAEQPIVVYIQSGSHLSDWNDSNIQTIKDAYASWEKALNGTVRFQFTDNPTEADTIISWFENSIPNSDAGHEAELRGGVCQTRNSTKWIVQQRIILTLKNSNGQANSSNQIYNIALHEIVHSLGFYGHSLNPGDVMFANMTYNSPYREKPTSRDIATLKKLYSEPALITNPPDIHLERFAKYFELKSAGMTALKNKDYIWASEQFRQALSIYDRESETWILAGSSLILLKQYDAASPLLVKAADMPGIAQGEAVKLAGLSLIQSGQADELNQNQSSASQKYSLAKRVILSHLQVPMVDSTAVSINQQLQWIARHQGPTTATVMMVRPTNSASARSNPSSKSATTGQPNETPKKKLWQKMLADTPNNTIMKINVPTYGGRRSF